MKQTSGLEALLEALKNSGVDFESGNPFAGAAGRGNDDTIHVDNEADQTSSSSGGSSSNGGGRRGRRGGRDASADFGSLFSKLAEMSKKAIAIAVVILIIFLLAAYWWFHPPINIHSVDTWTFVAIVILLPSFLLLRAKAGKHAKGTSTRQASPGKAKTFKVLSFIPVAVLLVGVIGGILSLSIIPGNAERYANVLQTTSLDFAEDIKEVDYSQIPVIDRDSASLLGNREMGSIPEYVSQFEISDLYSQINYKSTPVRVSPLEYADLFKWFMNKDTGIPAYSLVDMTTQNAQIVRLEKPIYYVQSEPLERNIDRYVQLKYPFYMFDEFSFEIDEDGQPWWICPVQTRTIGLFGGTTIERVVLCNATTGECQDLAVEDCPQWVDRVYPATLLIQQYNWFGSYNNGWLNSFIGQQGVVRTTPGSDGKAGYNYIAKDDDVWVYTGVTSATADNSIVGFVLINQRTQESHYYSVPGATEKSAMESAEGQVQNLRYTATFPILLNVAGQPTYFMALKDSAGLVKKFAMIDIQRYQNVAVGDTVAECQKAYEILLSTNGVSTTGSTANATYAKGVIRSMAQAVIESNSHFYVMLEGDKKIYDFALPGMLGIVAYKEGDTIAFTYLESSATCSVQSIEEVAATSDTSGTKASTETKA